MSFLPPHIAARRAERQTTQRRRRRLAVLLLAAGAVIVAAVVLAGGGDGGRGPSLARVVATAPRVRVRATRAPGSARHDAAAVDRLARLGHPVYCAGPRGRSLAFTFDDGPGPYTHFAITKLRQAHQRATFFAVGRSVDSFPGYLQREEAVATIADHTLTHPLLTAFGAAVIDQQIAGTKAKIESITGQRVQLFRPPYGAHNATVDAVARRLGLLEILWNVDSADSLGANYAGIIQNVEAGLHPGAIILMHENRGQTIRALTTILPELRRRHLSSVTLPELLASDPPSLAQLQAGPRGCSGTLLRGNGG